MQKTNKRIKIMIYNEILSVYNLVFITTFIDRNNIYNLIDSVVDNNNNISIFFILINQTNSNLVLLNSSHVNFNQINVERVSLSEARNIGVKYLLDNNIRFSHIMFPDDDTTFSNTFFIRYKWYVKENQNYLIDVYCFGSNKLFKQNNYNNGDKLFRNNYEVAMSVNMIINYNTFVLIGLFDERMGIGAIYGAGEDGDYYIRACNTSLHGFIFVKNIYNFHPSSTNKFQKLGLSHTINKYVNYGNGAIFMLCKHKMYMMAIKTCFRAIGGAIFSLYKFDFKLFVAFGIAFFSRLLMFSKCIIFFNRLYKYA